MEEQLTWAINHPVGDLTHALFLLLFRGPVGLDSGLPESLSTRLAAIIGSEKSSAQAGRVMIASRLFPLHFADPSWAKRHVVPCLDWERGGVALGCWQGYLWSPKLDARLFYAIKIHFLGAFERWERLGKCSENLGDLLISIVVDAEEGLLTSEQTRHALRLMGVDGKSHLAWALAKRLEQAEEQSANLWLDRIGPWIRDSWPRDLESREARTTNYLLWMATKTGSAFETAAEVLLSANILGNAHGRLLAVSELNKHPELVLAAPLTLLRLLDVVLPSPSEIAATGEWVTYGLGDLLKTIRAGAPEVTDTDVFRAVEERRSAGAWK